MLSVHCMNMKLKMKSEVELAEELGLPRDVLRKYRIDDGISGWVKKSNSIVYTEEGEHEIRNLVQKELLVDKMSEPLEVMEEREMVITGITRNRRLVLCGDIKVRVTDNKNFLKGMKLFARPPATGGRVWVMKGRCPRWRGKY
jgi:hypothetical protein